MEELLVAEVLVEDKAAVASRRAIVTYEGRLDARGRDSHLVLRLNGSSTGYRSFVIMDGNAGNGEWDASGFYIGRNGWNLDCHFSFRYIIAVETGRKRTGFGMSTFAHADERILGYTANGFWNNTNATIQSVQLYAIGGGLSVGNLDVAWE